MFCQEVREETLHFLQCLLFFSLGTSSLDGAGPGAAEAVRARRRAAYAAG